MKFYSDDEFLSQVKREYQRARKKFPPFKSEHEGYAVILEELDELWELVKLKEDHLQLIDDHKAEECIQIAAMAMAFYLDLIQSSASTVIKDEG